MSPHAFNDKLRSVHSQPDSNPAQAPAARIIVIDASADGQRVDNFLMRTLKGVPKSRIYRMLRCGEVRVNGGRRKPADRLAAGDKLRLPPVREAEREEAKAPPGLVDRLEHAVLLENDDLLVVNKAPGLAVHGGSGIRTGVIEALRAGRPQAPYLELAHRLDRDASGCLVIAKTRTALLALHEAFKSHDIDKRYRILVKGKWKGGARTVDLPLSQVRLGAAGRSSVVDDDGKESVSHFTPLETFAEASLMEVRILTGRMHQIRAHAAHLGHELAGDDRYGDFAFNRAMRKHGLKRMFLHAAMLRFQMKGGRVSVQAPLPEELEAVLDSLRHAGRGVGADRDG